MTTFENLSSHQKLRATVHRDTKSICSETCHLLGLEVTKPAMEVIAELVYKKISVYGADLEAFAKHAKRQTINADDVKLLVRRNPTVLAHISELAGNISSKEKRRKTSTPVAKQRETPAPKWKEKDMEKSPVVFRPPERKDVEAEQGMELDIDNMIDLTFE
ncbi:unnamed protein product [Plutella xylostella]|uniref:Centromere protein S n=1 Tax=Plutella xylostella TaxID=51655 RepID=A0A8S4FEJ0_PLUXY|nr:unnamed protein product [Plutella xylostella]